MSESIVAPMLHCNTNVGRPAFCWHSNVGLKVSIRVRARYGIDLIEANHLTGAPDFSGIFPPEPWVSALVQRLALRPAPRRVRRLISAVEKQLFDWLPGSACALVF
jgi:hypothetical protein